MPFSCRRAFSPGRGVSCVRTQCTNVILPHSAKVNLLYGARVGLSTCAEYKKRRTKPAAFVFFHFSVSLRSMTRCVETSMQESRRKQVAIAPCDGAHMPQSGAVPSRSCAKSSSFNSGYSAGSVRDRYGASPIAAAYPKTEDHQESSGFSSCFVVVQRRM